MPLARARSIHRCNPVTARTGVGVVVGEDCLSTVRRRELTRLAVDDYDPREHTLTIRESKFHKSRQIPVSADAAREIEAVLDLRRGSDIRPRRTARSCGIGVEAIVAAGSAARCARCSDRRRSGRRRASRHARMIFGTPLR